MTLQLAPTQMWSINSHPKHCAACRVSLVSCSPDVKVDLISVCWIVFFKSAACWPTFTSNQHAEFSAWPLSSYPFSFGSWPEIIRVKHSSYFFTEHFLGSSLNLFRSFESSQGEMTNEKTGPNEHWVLVEWTAFIRVKFWEIDKFFFCFFFHTSLSPKSRQQEHTSHQVHQL